ncbi:hypothetical protein EGW08_002892 [Elysia chlorotica]|uniref:phospholipase A2 n=1 Tax=Elysia chlorotica TaxID=188477 RepID=A0A3S1HZQ2_ELYCH|nr:hypothetical protein EGW08_002892 [Elysia chlorotica]
MKNLHILTSFYISVMAVLLIQGALAGVAHRSRHKRNALQMCELIAQHTNRGCLDFNNYGCFCGLGNNGIDHVDPVDGCCRVHDQCYGNVLCYWMYPQFVGYNIDCTAHPTEPCQCTDSPLSSPCSYSTCRCDLEFAQCLARAVPTYNPIYRNYDRTRCNMRPRRRQQRLRRRETMRSQLAETLWSKNRFVGV